jgi:hypothetical protein
LLAVRKREEQLDSTLAETAVQAQAIRQEADRQAHAVEETTRRQIDDLEAESKRTLRTQTQQAEFIAAQEIGESLRQVALLARQNMDETVQLLVREVLPAE